MYLMGVLEHGQRFVMYRTFGNVKSGADLTIYCILSQLESRLAEKGSLPPTIFIQFDWASDNANGSLLVLCEVLIAKKVFKEIFLTRLPVGQTHECKLYRIRRIVSFLLFYWYWWAVWYVVGSREKKVLSHLNSMRRNWKHVTVKINFLLILPMIFGT